MLDRLLGELGRQTTDQEFTYSIVVADNDPSHSAEPVVTRHRHDGSPVIKYCMEPNQNIAMARNRALQHASSEFVALIDDDEFPVPDWLITMLRTCERLNVAGVLGPVRPYFDVTPPQWVISGRFCERPEYHTGRCMDWEECRTGNVLFRRSILDGEALPFDPNFGNGGEDKDFFLRMMAGGHKFCWCNEGVTYEAVPPNRWTRSYMLRRALLRGKNVLKHPVGRIRLLAKSLAAVPVYCVMLPATFLFGQHVFMKYCIRFCDHLGRILAVLHLNPITDRH